MGVFGRVSERELEREREWVTVRVYLMVRKEGVSCVTGVGWRQTWRRRL